MFQLAGWLATWLRHGWGSLVFVLIRYSSVVCRTKGVQAPLLREQEQLPGIGTVVSRGY